MGFIMGHLTKLLEVKLNDASSIAVSYVILSDDGVEYMKTQKDTLEIKEGELPKSLED